MTAQVCEKIIYEGVNRELHSTPDIPEDEKILDLVDTVGFSSACWRGYVGTWEISENRLFLDSITGKYSLKDGQPVFANWFTGDLVIPSGGLLDYFHGDFGGDYEREEIISVVCGHVVKKTYVDRRPSSNLSIFKNAYFNRLLGRLVAESSSAWVSPDPFDHEKIIISFNFNSFIPFEVNSGRIAYFIQKLPDIVSVRFEEPSDNEISSHNHYLIMISLGAVWGKEITDFFGIERKAVDTGRVNTNGSGWISSFSRSIPASYRKNFLKKEGIHTSENFDDFDDEIPF